MNRTIFHSTNLIFKRELYQSFAHSIKTTRYEAKNKWKYQKNSVEIDRDTINLLERLSLVDCANEKSLKLIEKAVNFANQINSVDTEGVEPLITVAEDRLLKLREDVVVKSNDKEDILKNASKLEEDYFVVPPANVPLETEDLFQNNRNAFVKVIEYPTLKKFELKIGPTGALLQDNLKNEWHNNFVNNKDFSVFYSTGDFLNVYIYARNLLFQTVPFGIIEITCIKKNTFIDEDKTKFDKDFSSYFMIDFKLLYTIFVAPSVSNQMFHQVQRQRKIWWRKISASPGRYKLGDIQNDTDCSVNIMAKYPWGNQILESIKLCSNNYPGISNNDLLIEDGKKQVPAVYIQCETKLSNIFLNALCDAYEEPYFQGEKRPLLRFHRKMAPYKISFSISSQKNESLNELHDLATYLSKLLRNNYTTTLLIPQNVRKTLDAQYKQYDELGIPFTVVLNEATLKDGIAWLRSRDSTLKEQVHVADIVSYIEKIHKNF